MIELHTDDTTLLTVAGALIEAVSAAVAATLTGQCQCRSTCVIHLHLRWMRGDRFALTRRGDMGCRAARAIA
jgi:hypothetical protein